MLLTAFVHESRLVHCLLFLIFVSIFDDGFAVSQLGRVPNGFIMGGDA